MSEGQMVSLESDAEDGVARNVGPLRVMSFSLPDGCLGAYYPEMNALVSLAHHERLSKTPASKCRAGPHPGLTHGAGPLGHVTDKCEAVLHDML
ncbi:hypothetical protein DSM21852_28420 [Methylocystis bryophila]|nr:hypothetical protein DSM21852_28420 [Methylocystis bryophila]